MPAAFFPMLLHDIVPPRMKNSGRRIFRQVQKVAVRLDDNKYSFAHVAKRSAIFLFRWEPFVALATLVVFGLFANSLFTRATVSRLPSTHCEGAFAHPENATGAPDVKEDGGVLDFNDANSAAFQGGTEDISCDGFGRPDESFTNARLTFVLGIRKKPGAPLELPTSVPNMTPAPTAEQEGSVIASPTPSPSVILNEVKNPDSSASPQNDAQTISTSSPNTSPEDSPSETPSPSVRNVFEPEGNRPLPFRIPFGICRKKRLSSVIMKRMRNCRASARWRVPACAFCAMACYAMRPFSVGGPRRTC
jgi:hypothetical protein